MKTIGIVDYGAGNLGSIVAAFESLHRYAGVIYRADQITTADLIVLPGVGAAGLAMENLTKAGMVDALQERYRKGGGIIGICLGAQLCGTYLVEGDCAGFGWIAGSIEPLQRHPFFNNGWCQLDHDSLRSLGLARGLTPASTFYFNHRYALPNDVSMRRIMVRDRSDIPALYLDNALCAVQFHPEKSQCDGKIFLRNLIEDHYGF